MPATPARATCEDPSEAAPLPRPLTPGVSEDVEDDVAAAALLDERVTLLLVGELVELELFVAVMVTVLLARVTVFVMVEVCVRVVVAEVVVSCARARSGSRKATDNMLVNCMVMNSKCNLRRGNPR
jgi:hypothetical protein